MSDASRSPSQAGARVDVIIPVYGGYEETLAAVTSASRTLDRSWSRLVVINDCSPEPELTQWLREQAAALDFVLLENPHNLGFVGTVNRGMQLDPEADVLLLNSDVEVAGDWLRRLRATTYSRTDVASVTATANNATICSFPRFCEDNPLPIGFDVGAIDAAFARHVPSTTAVEVPTGIGCCMYLRRDALDRVGLFDEETFGRGYGEENDWCQRAIEQGFCNLHALDVFVYHKGGVSFADESNPRKEANLRVLAERHPHYIGDVHAFIARDPAALWRTRALLGLIGDAPKPKVLLLNHGLGGGVITHVRELMRECQQLQFLLLEPLTEGCVRLHLLPELEGAPSLDFVLDRDYAGLLELLKAAGIAHVHFHHTMRLPTRLWGLAKDLDCAWDYTLHDFWVINGNPTLTDAAGVYAGDAADRDQRCAQAYPLPEGVDSVRWRQAQLPLMQGARYLLCPSRDTLERIAREPQFTGLHNLRAVAHPDHARLGQDVLVRERGPRLRVVVLGALSREKGAGLLERIAVQLRDDDIEFHLLGYAWRELDPSVKMHGAYPEDECLNRLLALEPDVVWFPAQWPETYSYTLSAALEARLPIAAPRIGAFVERLAGREATFLETDYSSEQAWGLFWRRMLAAPEALGQCRTEAASVAATAEHPDFYRLDYVKGVMPRPAQALTRIDVLREALERSVEASIGQGRRERLLTLLVRLRSMPATRWMARVVPYSMQRRVKRWLSRLPLHDIKPDAAK